MHHQYLKVLEALVRDGNDGQVDELAGEVEEFGADHLLHGLHRLQRVVRGEFVEVFAGLLPCLAQIHRHVIRELGLFFADGVLELPYLRAEPIDELQYKSNELGADGLDEDLLADAGLYVFDEDELEGDEGLCTLLIHVLLDVLELFLHALHSLHNKLYLLITPHDLVVPHREVGVEVPLVIESLLQLQLFHATLMLW